MKFKLYLLLVFFFISGFLQAQNTYMLINGQSCPVVDGTVIIRVAEHYRNYCSADQISIPELQAAFQQLNVTHVRKAYPNHLPPARAIDEIGRKLSDLSLIYKVKLDPSASLSKVIPILKGTGVLVYAEPQIIPELLYNPNDPDTASQYYLGLIHAYEAWDIAQGDSNIVVGVTDTGTDLDHPDLEAGIKYNYNDPINGIDDDNDGYTDNFMGWDVGQNDNDPSIDIVHGSFVSGFAGAVTDNATGIAGPGFKTRFLPVKISSNGILIAAYDGIVYAADHGCQVINCSWGSFGSGQYGQDIIDYATINMGRLVVGAAGNSNNDAPFYPASYKGVLSVTGTNNTDTKWSNSSYGVNVDLSAPGEQVYSTIYDNTYSASSGTSFAAPIVAAGAALVMSANPFMSALQIGEQLRATADDIDGVPGNVAYSHQLGKGRLNLYRALTESAKSVRMEDIITIDGNDNAFVAGDTLQITGNLVNYLLQLSNLTVTLTSNSPDITILNGIINPGAMAMLATLSTNATPFTALIGPGIPLNSKVVFTLTYSDGTYSDWQTFEMVLNVDYINMLVNEIGVSITSKGRIGYNDMMQSQGIGVTFNSNSSHLYEGGFMVGTDTIKVSNQLFDSPVSSSATDFISMINVHELVPAIISDYDLESRFNDDGAGADKLDVEIEQHSYAWSDPANSRYVILEFVISNHSGSPLTNLYAGIYCDWDIGGIVDNKALYDAGRKMGYVYSTGSPDFYLGIKQLNSGGNNCYSFDNNGAAGSFSIYDGFTSVEKYTSMNLLRADAGVAGAGNDVSQTVASGPHTIGANDSIVVAFAIVGGEDLSILEDAADAAQIKYSTINSFIPIDPILNNTLHVYPNPVNNTATLVFDVRGNEVAALEIFDMLGNLVWEKEMGTLMPGTYTIVLDAGSLNQGVYQCRLRTPGNVEHARLIKSGN